MFAPSAALGKSVSQSADTGYKRNFLPCRQRKIIGTVLPCASNLPRLLLTTTEVGILKQIATQFRRLANREAKRNRGEEAENSN
jgi:hypothetical protein